MTDIEIGKYSHLKVYRGTEDLRLGELAYHFWCQWQTQLSIKARFSSLPRQYRKTVLLNSFRKKHAQCATLFITSYLIVNVQ